MMNEMVDGLAWHSHIPNRNISGFFACDGKKIGIDGVEGADAEAIFSGLEGQREFLTLSSPQVPDFEVTVICC